jgi:hypothetical protein
MTTAVRSRPAALVLPIGIGLALAWLLTAAHPEGTGEPEPEAPTCVGCHHGPVPDAPTSF